MGHVDMGLSQISHLQLRISTLILNEKKPTLQSSRRPTHTPGEGLVLPLSCIRRQWGKWRWRWNGKPPGGVFPSFTHADELSHVLRSALALAHPEIGICTSAAWWVRISNHEKSATCNHNHNYGISDPDLLNHSELLLFLGRKFVGSIQKNSPKNHGIQCGPILYLYTSLYNYILPFKKKTTNVIKYTIVP